MTNHLKNFQGIMNQFFAMGSTLMKKFKDYYFLAPYQIHGKFSELHCLILLLMVSSLWTLPRVVFLFKK